MAQVSTNIRAAHDVGGAGLVKRILLGLSAARQRRQLVELDDRQLRDIGLTAEEARAEARRPAWDVPQSWLR
ncbi:DUF1127 domain-containing protein [Rhodovulum sp. BSW8]|uniref:DUF1127 domain-containing protein n=1 Tax=Rhodovulum visakhapatnamense TaxID=364297 RepID=A0A4R8G044_9RHOB|nr:MULTISPECIES: DUF1127 domain-containing protein [Rhodovulum]OLS43972.1 hypothetical protein BV509_06210 [Rhodovulum sulfidophilum]MBL3570731.1 DUF1127 domain-containing protein [Rhodovulum visakhapatnamense]MBL3576870.1 DUF1127 domain-containing protein [Rhodovulum visakhapatnamense]RBO51428.1 DUF1127 domain-containing protein [Rhodovulum sp. BSW8]TDX31339.1 uncharacterized protein DUF1127 [Rhodovulum visakhapatnamense]